MGNSEEQPRTAPAPTPEAIELNASPSVRSNSSQRDPESSLQAWLCVVGSFLFLYPSYGFMQSVGTVQSYLQLNQLSSFSARDLGWISGIFTSLGLLLGIQAGPLMDAYGTKLLAPISAATMVPVFFLLGECKEYWHFILCLGVLGGIGGALSSTVALAVIGKLFNRRRGLAMGIALSGSSFGGVTLSMMFRSLLPKLGWQWAMRAAGFLVLGVMFLGVLCFLPYPSLVTSSSSAPVGRKAATLNFSAFKSPPFDFMTMGLFLLEFVLFGITGLLPTFAIAAGFPSNVGFSLIAILNGCSCLGRIASGIAGDRFGHLNVLLFMIIFTVIFTTVVLVPFGTKYIGALYTFSALWGFGSGSFLSITPVCLGKICEPKDYGRYLGTMNFVVSFSLLITVPIGGQMLESMGGTALSGFYVAIVFLGGVSYFAARSLLVGGWFTLNTRI
ncbi:MFS monocarboxylate [Colletotrichum truncatum]|uniref:MFS monocarboxylate n=1 Tax=Colletotrichum truncatum TaxID=5467 RepID=A0ACC3YVY1_COLTU|nr:MFS monocarboxylate [Colletotrichum truncatum]KAF6791156.1 MFS monocarboxylate [Colletotrichum truncatum]